MAEIHVKDYFSSSKAFLIAVSEYSVSSIPSLHSPHNDVNLLKKTLEEQHDFECKTLLNPGKAQLNDFLLSITAEEGDRVILYFAGHGVAADNGSLEGYLLPADANPAEPSTFIAIRELLRTLQRLKCRHFLLILDCCFSGISASGGHQYPGKAITLTETLYFEKFRHYVQHSARHLLVSLSLGNESQGILRLGRREQGKENEYSPFALQLCRAITRGTESSGNASTSGIITVAELARSLKAKIYPAFSPEERVAGHGRFVFVNPAFQESNGLVSLPNIPQESPYKGLSPFNREDAGFFYGRQRVLYGWSGEPGLKKSFEENNLLVVCGDAGTGKTSLLRAGLFPVIAHPEDILTMTPERSLTTSVRVLAHTSIAAVKPGVIFVDQYEAIFNYAGDDAGRTEMEDLLIKLAPACKIIIAIRSGSLYRLKGSDFFRQTTHLPGYRFKIFYLPPFEKNEIEEIIRAPAEQRLLYFGSAGTAERMAHKVFNRQELLPMLSLALNELFLQRENRTLQDSVYRSFSGIEGILDFKINRLKEKYSEPQDEELLLWLMLRMTSIQGGVLTRRKVYTIIQQADALNRVYDELAFWYDHTTTRLKEMAQDLIKNGLAIQEQEEDGRTFIQPAHDVVLLHWHGLREWLNKGDRNHINEQTKLMLHHAVSDSVMEYYSQSTNRIKKQYLWRDAALLTEIRKSLGPRLNIREEAFIRHCLNRAKRGRRAFSALIVTALVALAGVLVFFTFKAADALAVAKRTQSLSLLAMADASESTDGLNLLRLAYEKDSTNPAVINKIITFSEHSRDINRFLSNTTAFSHATTQQEIISDSLFFYNGPGTVTIRTASGEKKVTVAGSNIYPHLLLNTRRRNLAAYVRGYPLKILNFEGNVTDSVVTGVQDPYDRVQFQWVENHLILQLPKFVVVRTDGINDTIQPRPGATFTAVCPSPAANEIFLGASDGAFFSYSFVTKKLRFIKAGDQSIRFLTLLPKERICLVSSDSLVTILNGDFEKFNYLKGRKVTAVQPFVHSSRLLLHTVFPSDSLMTWNYENGTKILLQEEPVDDGHISAREDYILTTSKTTVKLWDDKGNLFFNYRMPEGGQLSGGTFFTTRSGFAAISTSPGGIYSWHLDSSALYTGRYTGSPQPDDKTLSPRGDMLARVTKATASSTVTLYGADSGRVTGTLATYHFTGRERDIRAIDFSANENELIIYFENGVVKNYLTPKGAGKWIREVKSAPLSTAVKEKYGL